jgi:hypothetical protein
MTRYKKPISLPAMAIAAVLALSVSGGIAALFQSRIGIAEPSVYTLAAPQASMASAATAVLPMREIVPNRVEVIGVREPERLGFFQRVAQRVRGS